jgi:hypothetical protein
LYFYLKNRNRNCYFSEDPLPLGEGIKGRGNLSDNIAPSPQPSPIKGEGIIKKSIGRFCFKELIKKS